MSEDLKPCPFCGSRASIYCDDFINGRVIEKPDWIISCEGTAEACGEATVRVEAKSPESAISTWNRRADLSALSALSMRDAAAQVLADEIDLARIAMPQCVPVLAADMRAIRALPLPPPEALLAAALRLPEVKALVEAVEADAAFMEPAVLDALAALKGATTWRPRRMKLRR